MPDEWNNVEILLFSKEDADYYEYYLEGNLVSEGTLASRMTSSSKVLLKQKQNNLGIAYATDKYICLDDIRIDGGQTVTVNAALDALPIFEKITV